MKLSEITSYIDSIAPPAYQESYDNAGLIVGDPSMEITSALICLDSTEEVIDEAIANGCNLVIAHHPIVFGGLKKFNGKNYVERVVMKAIKNDIAIYAAHTNLDNVTGGVNSKIAEKLGLINTRILAPKKGLLRKLVTFCPIDQADKVRQAIFNAGAGNIGNYDECSFNTEGTGTFRGGDDTTPYVGNKGEQHHEKEVKIETIYPAVNERAILKALFATHPYEEVAYDIYPLENELQQVGSGMIGELENPMDEMEFLAMVKANFKAECIRYTQLMEKPVKTVAFCGGAGSFLLRDAMSQKADVFITGDYKYHQFFDAENRIVIADIGHYESEQYTSELFRDILNKKFPNFATRLSDVNTNPIYYL